MEQHPHLTDFDQPWCLELLGSTEYARTSMDSQRRAGGTGPNENSFFAKTIGTSLTMRATIPLLKKGSSCGECAVLISLGPGLNGHSDFLAGSLACTFFDEVMGLSTQQIFPRNAVQSYFTGELNVRYLKPAPCPGLILVKARIVKQQGRKMYTEATLEDGMGTVYSKCDGIYVQTNRASI